MFVWVASYTDAPNGVPLIDGPVTMQLFSSGSPRLVRWGTKLERFSNGKCRAAMSGAFMIRSASLDQGQGCAILWI